jgi:predicted transcriptional regulator of viral defense system
MSSSPSEAVRAAEQIFRENNGVLRTSSAMAQGVHPRTLYWMRDHGLLEQLSRGVYHLTAMQLPEQPDVVAVTQRVPNGVVALVTALELHGLTTQIPHAVDVALERGIKRPRIDYPPIRVFYMSPVSFRVGVEHLRIGGHVVPVFGAAKTVADCFKYRSRVGHDVAVEALREVIRARRSTPAEVMAWARVDRVGAVVRPYLEALQ